MDRSLKELVLMFDRGEIALPIMQRSYVWNPKKVENLLESLYKKWPIGAFYLWRPRTGQATRNGHVISAEYYLLDGQQRLTSISRAIKGENDDQLLPIPGGKGVGREINWGACFDMENELFLLPHSKQNIKKVQRNPKLMRLSDLIPLSNMNELDVTTNIDQKIESLFHDEKIANEDASKYRTRLSKVSCLLDSRALVQEVDTREASSDEEETEQAIQIFQRLNNGGTKLDQSDLLAARLSQQHTAKVLPAMRVFVGSRERERLGLNFAFATRALITMHRENASLARIPNNWASKNGQSIEHTWERTEKSLVSVVNFIGKNAGWTSSRWLPSTNALLPVTFLAYNKNGALSNQDHVAALRFLCVTGCRHTFGSAADTKINRFIRLLNNKGNRAINLVSGLTKAEMTKIEVDDILTRQRLNSRLMQVYLAYLLSENAKSWIDGESILSLSRSENTAALSVHHIFPRRYGQDKNLNWDWINCMANYAIISQSDNSKFRDDEPADRYIDLTGEQKRRAKTQFISIGSDDLLTAEYFQDFVERRARDLARALNRFLGLI